MSLVLDGTAGMTAPQGAVYNGIQSGTAVASTSGTSITFSSIPSWVKRITVMFNGVSTSGTTDVQIQLGAGSVTTTGYAATATNLSGSVATTGYTTGFGIQSGGAAALRQGIFIISNVNGNTWVASGNISITVLGNYMSVSAGTIALSGTLDRVVVTTTNGTDTFDAGSINILYE